MDPERIHDAVARARLAMRIYLLTALVLVPIFFPGPVAVVDLGASISKEVVEVFHGMPPSYGSEVDVPDSVKLCWEFHDVTRDLGPSDAKSLLKAERAQKQVRSSIRSTRVAALLRFLEPLASWTRMATHGRSLLDDLQADVRKLRAVLRRHDPPDSTTFEGLEILEFEQFTIPFLGVKADRDHAIGIVSAGCATMLLLLVCFVLEIERAGGDVREKCKTDWLPMHSNRLSVIVWMVWLIVPALAVPAYAMLLANSHGPSISTFAAVCVAAEIVLVAYVLVRLLGLRMS